MQVKRAGGELKVASQALAAAAAAKATPIASKQHSPAREHEHPQLLKDVVKQAYKHQQHKKLHPQLPKGGATAAASLVGTPAFKNPAEKPTSFGGKRLSVALIPARRDHPSPLRSSQDNLGAAYHTAKGSLVVSPQASGAPTGSKAMATFGSKRNSVGRAPTNQ